MSENFTFRPATEQDTEACIDMVYSSGPEVQDYIFNRGKTTAKDYIRHEFSKGGGFLGHRVHTVVEHEGKVIGVGAFYYLEQTKEMEKESFSNLLSFFNFWRLLQVLYYSLHTKSIVEPPREGSVYIADLGVNPEYRGKGVGSALLQHATEKAKANGFREMSLDVALNNPRAEALYSRLGFTVVKEKQFKGKKGSNVPDSRLMVKAIN